MNDDLFYNFWRKFDRILHAIAGDKRKAVEITLLLLFYKFISKNFENKFLLSSFYSDDPSKIIDFIRKAFHEYENEELSDIFSYYNNFLDDTDIKLCIYPLIHLVNEYNIDNYNYYNFWKLFIDKLSSQRILSTVSTPLYISELVSKIIDAYMPNQASIKICDTTCGTGLLISDVCHNILNNKSITPDCEASDILKQNCILTKMTMFIAGVNTEIHNEDILVNYQHLSSDADFVVSDIPMTIRWGFPKIQANDPRFEKYVSSGPLYSDYLFLLHDLFRINNNGIALLIMNYALISHPCMQEKLILEKLIDNNKIEAIIKLPAGTLRDTGVNQCLLILKQKKNNNNIMLIDASNNQETGVKNQVDMDEIIRTMSNSGKFNISSKLLEQPENNEKYVKKQSNLTSDKIKVLDIDRIMDALVNKKSIRGFSKSVSSMQIEKKLYSLNVALYVDPIMDIMKSEDLADLLDYVDVFYPNMRRTRNGKVFKPKDMKYPIDYENMDVQEGSSVEVHEGDIIFRLSGNCKAFYVNSEPNETVLLLKGSQYCIFRMKNDIKNVSAKYICMYLNSQTIRKIMSIYSDGLLFQRLSRADIESFKIIKPHKDVEYYAAMFNYQISPHNSSKELLDITNNYENDKNIESLFIIEQIQKLWGNRQNELQEVFNSDLTEVQNCIRAKAYKSALIMCGAILEAFLVDWLNEKDPKGDWLSAHDNDKTGKYNLCNYINQIKEIQKPRWIDPAKKAHIIREKRNLVHATLCLNSQQTIDNNLCLEVLKYLKYVMSTRWK